MNADKTSRGTKSDNQRQAKRDLLRELESLRTQLADPDVAEISDDDIPLLIDKVDKAVRHASGDQDEASDLAAMQAAYDDAAQALETKSADSGASRSHTRSLAGQQSLFGGGEADEKPRARPVARGENPFLPKHIRDRLDERRQALADDIAQASAFFPPKRDNNSPAAGNNHPDAHQALVDELVAQYLPRIERELRMRLTMALRETLEPSADKK